MNRPIAKRMGEEFQRRDAGARMCVCLVLAEIVTISLSLAASGSCQKVNRIARVVSTVQQSYMRVQSVR
jgi:hypothetical protein